MTQSDFVDAIRLGLSDVTCQWIVKNCNKQQISTKFVHLLIT